MALMATCKKHIPVAQAWNVTLFGNYHFFAFLNVYRGIRDILPGWELVSGIFFQNPRWWLRWPSLFFYLIMHA